MSLNKHSEIKSNPFSQGAFIPGILQLELYQARCTYMFQNQNCERKIPIFLNYVPPQDSIISQSNNKRDSSAETKSEHSVCVNDFKQQIRDCWHRASKSGDPAYDQVYHTLDFLPSVTPFVVYPGLLQVNRNLSKRKKPILPAKLQSNLIIKLELGLTIFFQKIFCEPTLPVTP